MEEDIKIKYQQELEKHVEYLRGVKNYSIQRIDLLVISISGAGTYTCFEIMKYIDASKILNKYENLINAPYKMSGVLFILSIILNFVSQWSAYKGSGCALESTKKEIYQMKNNVDNNKDIKKLDSYSTNYNRTTKYANFSSLCLMIFGLITLLCSFLNLF